MAEEVTKTIENVDRMFSEIIINGEVHRSQRYQSPSAVQQTSEETIQGEDVHAVELNRVLHDFSDPDVIIDVENLQQDLTREINTRSSEVQILTSHFTDEVSMRQNADNILQSNINTVSGNVSTLQTSVGTLQSNVSTLQGKVTIIEGKIPSQASSSNQLADKDFVNSSISSNTANFLGTYTSMSQIEAIQNPTNNDYVFLQTTDSAGNTIYDRYKYNASSSEWLFEYELNNSSFTAEQWATINSGLTQNSVSSDILNAINALDVASTGGNGKYIKSISEADGKISAVEETMDTVPTLNSDKAITSGAVKTAVDNEATARDTAIANAIDALDVELVGGDGKYIKSIKEGDGKISAVEETMDTVPVDNSNKACTSGGIRFAIDVAEIDAKNLSNATGTLSVAHGGTGKTTQAEVNKAIINAMASSASDVTDGTELITSYASNDGFSDTNAVNVPYKRSFLHVWNYIVSKITGAISTVLTANLTASRVLISNSSGKVAVSSITPTKLGYLTDVTSNIQAQLNAKQPKTLSSPVSVEGQSYSTVETTLNALANNVGDKTEVGTVISSISEKPPKGYVDVSTPNRFIYNNQGMNLLPRTRPTKDRLGNSYIGNKKIILGKVMQENWCDSTNQYNSVVQSVAQVPYPDNNLYQSGQNTNNPLFIFGSQNTNWNTEYGLFICPSDVDNLLNTNWYKIGDPYGYFSSSTELTDSLLPVYYNEREYIFIATNQGLYVYDISSNGMSQISGNYVKALTYSDGNVFFADSYGIHKYEIGQTITMDDNESYVKRMIALNDGSIMAIVPQTGSIGIRKKGIWNWNYAQGLPNGALGVELIDIYQTSNGSIYVIVNYELSGIYYGSICLFKDTGDSYNLTEITVKKNYSFGNGNPEDSFIYQTKDGTVYVSDGSYGGFISLDYVVLNQNEYSSLYDEIGNKYNFNVSEIDSATEFAVPVHRNINDIYKCYMKYKI
jgi:predicted nuclease with RNAse H fold